MKITLNGQIRELDGALDLKGLMNQFCRDKTPVIAEINGKIIHDPGSKEIALKEGDTVELVSFVGGGQTTTSNEQRL